ncbi:hypothetical protein TNIN_296151, partial [Trichonephila inaurata madagascariensis]
CNFQKKMTST